MSATKYPTPQPAAGSGPNTPAGSAPDAKTWYDDLEVWREYDDGLTRQVVSWITGIPDLSPAGLVHDAMGQVDSTRPDLSDGEFDAEVVATVCERLEEMARQAVAGLTVPGWTPDGPFPPDAAGLVGSLAARAWNKVAFFQLASVLVDHFWPEDDDEGGAEDED
jgi:hypothetical protein